MPSNDLPWCKANGVQKLVREKGFKGWAKANGFTKGT